MISALAVQFRDLDLAEDAFADAAIKLIEHAERPERVASWLFVVARRKVLDAVRRQARQGRALERSAPVEDMADIFTMPEPIADERLRLIFICCHPALAIEARTALALKVICGLRVDVIARLFVTSEATMYQRITRAKAKVRDAGIAFELPPRKAWGERLEAVLLTLELAYTAAYQDAAGEIDPELSAEVARLAALIAELLPEEPEALGLAALVWLARSREAARLDASGAMVPLSQQDTRNWDFAAIETARNWLDRAAKAGSSGPYQVMAAIQLTHARKAFDGATDWAAVAAMYDALMAMRPGPMIAVNRAVALEKTKGASAALEALDAIEQPRVRTSRPYLVARAQMYSQLGQSDAARKELSRALAQNVPRAERLFLERKLSELAQNPRSIS
ncbi:RNA polymerase subunit sigma-24 [Erythrobacter sp. KY5]|nr:RNA polymerase subunit sigma-24 [Erythrobacter sp. KY5]